MTIALFAVIRLPYFRWKQRVVVAGCAPQGEGAPNLSGHLLRDIGLMDGHETIPARGEPACSARDLSDRYR
jgi:hypothetical protein